MAEMLVFNPAKKKKKKKKSGVNKVKSKQSIVKKVTVKNTTTKKIRKKYRKNPSKKGIAGIINNTIVPSAVAAGGAVGLDVIMGYLPIPDTFKSGPLKHVVKGVGAIGMGIVASMFLKPETAKLITTGAMTVVLHSVLKDTVQKSLPNITLGEYDDDGEYGEMGYPSPAMPVGEYLDSGAYMGAESDPQMGEYLEGLSLDDPLTLTGDELEL